MPLVAHSRHSHIDPANRQGLGVVFLDAPIWLVALLAFCLAVALGTFAAALMIAEAKRQGWGTNREQ